MLSDMKTFPCWKFSRIFHIKSDRGSYMTVQCKACLPALKLKIALQISGTCEAGLCFTQLQIQNIRSSYSSSVDLAQVSSLQAGSGT